MGVHISDLNYESMRPIVLQARDSLSSFMAATSRKNADRCMNELEKHGVRTLRIKVVSRWYESLAKYHERTA